MSVVIIAVLLMLVIFLGATLYAQDVEFKLREKELEDEINELTTHIERLKSRRG